MFRLRFLQRSITGIDQSQASARAAGNVLALTQTVPTDTCEVGFCRIFAGLNRKAAVEGETLKPSNKNESAPVC